MAVMVSDIVPTGVPGTAGVLALPLPHPVNDPRAKTTGNAISKGNILPSRLRLGMKIAKIQASADQPGTLEANAAVL